MQTNSSNGIRSTQIHTTAHAETPQPSSKRAITSIIPPSKFAIPSIGTSDCMQPSLKLKKMDKPTPSHSSQNETSQAPTLIMDQTHSPQGQHHVRPEMSTYLSTETENMKLDADTSTSSSKASHAKYCEAKVYDSEIAIKVQLGIETCNPEDILTQCEQGKKQVQTEVDKLKMAAACKKGDTAAQGKWQQQRFKAMQKRLLNTGPDLLRNHQQHNRGRSTNWASISI